MSKKQNSLQMVIDDLEASMIEVEDSASGLWAVSIRNSKSGETSIKTVRTEQIARIVKHLFWCSNDAFWIDFMMDRYTGSCEQSMSEAEAAGYGDSQERF